jgi:G:T-mismatch repair DNA endonuclease (very short patch repair protein)
MPPQRNQNELIEQTRDYWKRRTQKATSEDARQITENLTGSSVLVEWEAAERRPLILQPR